MAKGCKWKKGRMNTYWNSCNDLTKIEHAFVIKKKDGKFYPHIVTTKYGMRTNERTIRKYGAKTPTKALTNLKKYLKVK